jgi:PAS domain S-box-containing protein
MKREQNGHEPKEVIRIVVIYALFSSIWIYSSDSLLEIFASDPKVLTRLAIYKGLLFILCTAALLYKLISRYAIRQQQVELELRRYYDIVDRMQVGLYVYRLEDPADDRSLRLVTANPASTKELGLPIEEIIGLRIDEVFPRLRELDIPRRFAEVVRSGNGFEIEEFGYKDDRLLQRSYSFKVFPLPGSSVGVLFEDITPRRQAEERLRASEGQFRTLCDFAPIGIFKADCLGNNTYSNPQWEKISGLSAEESLGSGWNRAIHPDDRGKAISTWSQAAASGHPLEREVRYLTPQGKTVWVRVLASPIEGLDGMVSGYVGTVEDVTEHRLAREEMLKSQKLESLGILAGGIAHDFNNILMAIFGNISLARLQMHEPELLAERLAEAESAASRAKGLTRQLITFARGGEPVKRVFELKGVIKEAAGFATRGSTVSVDMLLADDLSLVEADEGQLSQVIHNLVINAVQAMPDGGTVTIRAENFSSPTGKRFAKVSVTDTGVGISEQHLQRIFDPYFTTKQQGSGLGLATCHSIVRKHGGIITVDSTLGKGSTFTVSLPALDTNRYATPDGQAVVAHGSGRVLVMDDEKPVRKVMQEMLEMLGYTVECTADGDEAVDLYRKRHREGVPFDAVIMDLTVPGGRGGKDATRDLLALDPMVKVVVSSGYADNPVVAHYREHGFSAVLRKPYRLQELSQVLRELFGAD